jgi:hypothetical protein
MTDVMKRNFDRSIVDRRLPSFVFRSAEPKLSFPLLDGREIQWI